MATSISSRSLFLKSTVAFIGITVSQMLAADELPYATATKELKNYCIAEICLGETIYDISKKGKLAFSEFGLPDGKLTCSELGNVAFGDFIAKDGRAFKVSFELVSTKGEPATRYRLTHVKIQLPKALEFQLDHLLQILTTRYSLRKIGEPELSMWIGETISGQFSITASKWWGKPEIPPDELEKLKGLSLNARFLQKKNWLMNQAECQSGLPKI